jgi:hypothetical protein
MRPRTTPRGRSPADRPWIGSAVITFVALILVFAAFDDITTGNEPDFVFEYAGLAACAGWLLFLSVQLARHGHVVLGGLSLAALLVAAWGQRAIGPGITPGLWPEYVATVSAFAWFVVLGVALLMFGHIRDRDGRAAGRHG